MLIKILRKYRMFLLVLLGLFFFGQQRLFAQLSDKEKARWIIINIAQNTNWTSESSIRTYTIATFGYSGVYSELVKLSSNNLIKGKSFKVEQYRRVKDIGPVHVLYVPQSQFET
jgi:hypothetical protein